MTVERFVVPAPSEKAILNAHGTLTIPDMLEEAFAADVPGIVRREVEAALRASNREWIEATGYWHPDDLLYRDDRDYLTARYGPAPETGQQERPISVMSGQCQSTNAMGVRCSRWAGHFDDHSFKESPVKDTAAPVFTREAEAYIVARARVDVMVASDSNVVSTARAYLASREGK